MDLSLKYLAWNPNLHTMIYQNVIKSISDTVEIYFEHEINFLDQVHKYFSQSRKWRGATNLKYTHFL